MENPSYSSGELIARSRFLKKTLEEEANGSAADVSGLNREGGISVRESWYSSERGGGENEESLLKTQRYLPI